MYSRSVNQNYRKPMNARQPVFPNRSKRFSSRSGIAAIMFVLLELAIGAQAAPPPQSNDRLAQRQKQRSEHRMRIAEEEYRQRSFPLDAIPDEAMAPALKETQPFETRTRGPLRTGADFW